MSNRRWGIASLLLLLAGVCAFIAFGNQRPDQGGAAARVLQHEAGVAQSSPDAIPSEDVVQSFQRRVVVDDTPSAAGTGSPAPTGNFYVRVVTELGKPVENAKVQVFDRQSSDGFVSLSAATPDRMLLSERASGLTAANGLASLAVENLSTGLVCASGAQFGLTPCWPPSGRFLDHSTPENAMEVVVRAGATVSFLAQAGTSPVPGLKVELIPLFESLDSISHHPKAAFEDQFLLPLKLSRLTDAAGECSFQALPTGVPIEVRVTGKQRSIAMPDSPMSLKPGEARALAIPISAPVKVQGIVLTINKEPVGNLSLWVMEDHGTEGLGDSVPRRMSSKELVWKPKTVVSDAAGRFEFDAQPNVRLWIGPVPPEQGTDNSSWAPIAMAIRPSEDPTHNQIELIVARGTYVTGTVVDLEGKPAGKVQVSLRSSDSKVVLFQAAKADGRFAIGPLEAGHYLVRCLGGRKYAPSDEQAVEVNEATLPLRVIVGIGMSVDVEIVDGMSGSPRPGTLMFWNGAAQSMTTFSPSKPISKLHVEGLLAGSYSIVARTADGAIGEAQGVAITKEGLTGPVRVLVEEGGQVSVLFKGPQPTATLTISRSETRLDRTSIKAGEHQSFLVPTGNIRVELEAEGAPSQSKEESVDAGETHPVEFGSKP